MPPRMPVVSPGRMPPIVVPMVVLPMRLPLKPLKPKPILGKPKPKPKPPLIVVVAPGPMLPRLCGLYVRRALK